MKLLLLIFFTLTLPVTIFLTTILYGGINNTVIKEELLKAGVYAKVSSLVEGLAQGDDADSAEFINIIKDKINSTYVQSKAESIIDSSYGYVTSKTEIPPTISFKELKDEVMSKNPELLASMEDMANEAKTSDDTQDAQMKEGMAKLQDFAKSDFTFPLEKQLKPVKTYYAAARIAQPIFIFLLLGSVVLVGILAPTKQSKTRWMGATLATAGVWGFLLIFFNGFILSVIEKALGGVTNEVASVASPIVLSIISRFNQSFMSYQGMVSIALFLVAAGIIAYGELTNNENSIKPVKKKK